MIRALFLPLSVSGVAPGAQASADTAMLARWLPELVSRLFAGPSLATAYARMAGQTKEGAPVLVAFTKPMPDDQARALGKQHAAQKVVTGILEDAEKVTVRMQILDVESGSSRLLEDITLPRENLEKLPAAVGEALVAALEVSDTPPPQEELLLPHAAAQRAFFQTRDVVARLEIGARPPADDLEQSMEPFFELADAVPGSKPALDGLVAALGRFFDPRAPQLAEAAKPILGRALEIFDDSPQLWHIQASVHATFSQPPATDEAEETLKKAIELDLGYLPARFALADLYRFLGQQEEEDALYTELADHAEHGAAVRERYGTALAGRGEMDAAEAQWLEALELDPAFTPALRNMAAYCNQRGEQERSRQYFEKAAARPEKMPLVLYEYATMLAGQEQPAAAIPYLQRHLRYAPGHIPSVVALGNAQRGLGDTEAAKNAYRKAVEMDPRGPAGADARLALFGIEQPERATEMDTLSHKIWESTDAEGLGALRTFLDGDEELGLWQPWYALGIGHRNLAEWEKAEETLGKALELCPGQPDVQTALGTCHLHFAMAPTGQMDGERLNKAMSLIGPALRARPGDVTILSAFGLIYHLAGQFAEAEKAYRKALEIAPDDPTVTQYLASLEQWKAGNRAPVI